MRSIFLPSLTALVACACPAAASATDGHAPEAAAAAFMDEVTADHATLRLFLQRMPKGGDLHNHLGGAIYAEDMLRWAGENGQCVTVERPRIAPPPCRAPDSVPATAAAADPAFYARAVDALSTRGFEQGVGDPARSGADRFFATFDLFGPAFAGHVGDALAVAREQGAADHLQYLELQIGAVALNGALPAGWADGVAADDPAALLARLEPHLATAVAATRAGLDQAEARAAAIDGCGGATPAPACAVKVRYLLSAMRTFAPARVFAEIAFGFALARGDGRVVGVDIVAPEHDPVAIRDYRLHMAMFAFLRRRFPEVRLTLHAGELAPGMVPPRDLSFHIHDAVAVAGARRIGHGVDIAQEADAPALLARMARERIAVEINLTSNAVILGVKGRDHPLALYRRAGVPVALSTDDEGVSRIDLTHEYLRAVTEQGLDYRALKRIARDSLEYSFAPGRGIWADRPGGALRPPCAPAPAGPACGALAAGSEKAAIEIALERELATFERTVVPSLRALAGQGPVS